MRHLDWYAPKYMSRHTFDEIAGWFRDAGLTDLVDLTAIRFSSTKDRETASTWPAAGRGISCEMTCLRAKALLMIEKVRT